MSSYALLMTRWTMQKTMLPSLQVCNKMISSLGQLPITLMGMIVHGHGDERYTQYSNELWPNDPNFTIRSLLWLLRTLEVAPISNRNYCLNTPRNSFFERMLQGKSHCICKSYTPNQIVGPKLLPINLLLQMDNCVKDNKNWHLLVFLSLLMVRDVFEEVKLGFLIVGHTHEDIDGCFSYLSKTLKEENNYILVDLMKAFMILHEKPFIPQLIQKIPYFKSCLKDGLELLVRHIDMHLFRFFVDSSCWLVMQYKVSPIDIVWSPIHGLLIKLWKVNPDGSPKLSTRVPSFVLYCSIQAMMHQG
jgi:hypothetical protein